MKHRMQLDRIAQANPWEKEKRKKKSCELPVEHSLFRSRFKESERRIREENQSLLNRLVEISQRREVREWEFNSHRTLLPSLKVGGFTGS